MKFALTKDLVYFKKFKCDLQVPFATIHKKFMVTKFVVKLETRPRPRTATDT